MLPASCTRVENIISVLDAGKVIPKQENLGKLNHDELHTTPLPLRKRLRSEIVSSDKNLTAGKLGNEDATKSIGMTHPEYDKIRASNGITNSKKLTLNGVTPLATKKRKECDKDDDDSKILMDSPPFELSGGDDDAPESNGSEKRRKIMKQKEIEKIAVCPKSWMCPKCSALNSQKARSCDVCGIMKPSAQFSPKKKADAVFVLGVKQKQKPGRKPRIKVTLTENQI